MKLNINLSKKNKLRLLLIFFACGVLLGCILLIFPLWPKIIYTISKPDPNTINYPVSFAKELGLSVSDSSLSIPQTNRLVIPKIGVDSEILEGSTVDVLLSYEGVWREPDTLTPNQQGNMVIAGHRFQYLPPNTNTFYNIEEVGVGDKILVYWNQKPYVYKVYSTFVVTPDQIEIKNSDANIPHELTLYTCTPLYTSENRFVVKAELIN